MIDSIETAKGVKEVRVRRAKRGFGPGTLPYLRARANEIVAGPEYLLTRQADEETIWERTFHRIIRVPNRLVRSWSIFETANEGHEAPQGAIALRSSSWDTQVDLSARTWETTDKPSVDSKIGLFSDELAVIMVALQELDNHLYAGIHLDRRTAPVEWEEQIVERVFANGVFRLTIMRDVSNEQLDVLAQSLSDAIEIAIANSNNTASVDSLDVVYAQA